ncbi:uncharacterized protein LOC107727552 [Sinocyclocheilus rhinocerous]|uniref:uncharacterized protein LOC107727552 n=1 Tax=Sinocyclocheilus rhinocerous TaxID=307959 RepID=UPI0007B8E00F|nr:PREDICTED: uncharacterized protein LOC107727552 [Sinocyclocheilus rhinocerous]XP_016392930.1 PREDICTED: uncharacterized protein LOC107727552 [Sinocyclocheilus rhinocerous]XP_016392931.1 PREDICTED: uncharacterized protein LOC107727552 [Sinocyclocheilus rhinocerous]
MTRPGHLRKGHVLSRVPFLGRRMFSETKGVREPRIQPTTSSQLQNGIQRPQADILAYFGTGEHGTNTCGPKQQNSPLNGYTAKKHLDVQGGHAQLDVTGQICQTSVRWNRPPGKGLQHNSVSVNYSLRECSFVVHRHQTEPHPFLRKCALDAPTQFRGHGNCGVPVCAAEQQSGSVQGALLTEQHATDWMDSSGVHNSTFNKDAELCSSNRQGTLRRCLGPIMQDLNGPCLANEVMLSTKDVNKTNSNYIKCQAKVVQGDLNVPGRGSYAFSSQSERAIRDQIQRVVVNLEEVLHGLKEIHLEMKEVVQKIDLMTADIDIGNEEPGKPLKGCHSGRIDTEVASSQGVCSDKSSLKTPTPSVAPSAYPIKDQGLHDAGQKWESTQELVISQRHTSGTSSRRRSQKPPPYPYASTMGRVNPKEKDKGQKTPPYPFRRRLLSTIV